MERYWGPILWIPVCLYVCIVKLGLLSPEGVSLMSALGCMCVLLHVYTLVRHLFSGFLTVAKSSKDIGGPFCGFQYVLMFAL